MGIFHNHYLFKGLFFTFYLFFYLPTWSQDLYLDSLKQTLLKPSHDTTKLNTLGLIIDNLNMSDKDFNYCNNQIGRIAAKNLTNKEINNKEQRVFLKHLSIFFNNRANEYSAIRHKATIQYYDHAIHIVKYLKMYNELNYILVGKGVYLDNINNYNQSLECYFEALKYFEHNKDIGGAVYVYSNLASVYNKQENYKSAIQYYEKSLQYYNTLSQLTSEDINQKSIISNNIGTAYLSISDYNQAGKFFRKALDLAYRVSDQHLVSVVMSKIGLVNLKQNQLDSALYYYQQSLKLSVNDLTKANALIKLGELDYNKNMYSSAEQYLLEGLVLSRDNKNSVLSELASQFLYKIYKATGQYAKSLQMFETYTQLKDSSKIEASRNKLIQQQLSYDYEKKELQIKLEQEKNLSIIKLENEKKSTRKNILMFVLISIALLLCISIFYLYKFFKQRRIIDSNKNNELRQSLLRTQMNPHFIFNSIDNIQSLIFKDKGKEAIDYLTKFSKLTRQILENSNEAYITLEEEGKMLNNYLSIQQLLHDGKFDYEISIGEEIEADMILIPPMLTQPFIENAIKHGLRSKSEGGLVKVIFSMNEKRLFFQVLDNGSGLLQKVNSDGHKSMATEIVNERLNEKHQIVIEQNNLVDENTIVGMETLFEIPYIYDR
jgi:tetratricopeptide (TPR) repeat protein